MLPVVAARPAAHGRLVATTRRPQWVVAGEVARKATRSGAVWGVVFALYVVAQTFAYVSAYRTQAARDQLANAFGANIGINALIGPARAINTVAGYSSWRSLGILSLLGGIWGLLTSTRLLRGDEESGTYELLLVGQTTRRRAAVQTLAGLWAGLLALFVPTAIGTVLTGRAASVRFGTGASLYFAVTLVCGAAAFVAVGAVCSQLTDNRRRAATLAGAVFGVAYALRMVADSDRAVHWLVWLSPLGWIEESRPLTHPQPAALLPVLGLVVGATVLAVHLAGRRDYGAATLPVRDTARPRLRLLNHPLVLPIRLLRPTVLGWLFAVFAFSLLIGTVAESATKALSGNNAIVRALERLSGHRSLVEAYLGLTFLMLSILLGLIAAGQVTAARAEEAEGRLDNLMVCPMSRMSWYGGRMVIALGVVAAGGLTAGTGAWLGATSQRAGVPFSSLIEAGVNVMPPAVFLLGLGGLVLGCRPRWTSTVLYGYLSWSFLVEFVGAVVKANHWILDTSVFFHIAPAPATAPRWGSAAVVLLVGAGLGVAGAAALRRRDLTGA